MVDSEHNYYYFVKLRKVKKIHNFMLTDFREIISQHHNMVPHSHSSQWILNRTRVFVQICQIWCCATSHRPDVIGSLCHKRAKLVIHT